MTSTHCSETRTHRNSRSGRIIAAILGAGLLAIAGCSSTPSRPTTPVYTGKERPDPTRPPRPDDPKPKDESGSDGKTEDSVETRGLAQAPRHMRNKMALEGDTQLSRIAVLLPFSSSNTAARKQADGIMEGVEAALFNAGLSNIVLLPKDTKGIPASAKTAAEEAVADGADIILGPVFNHNITPVNSVASENRIPVLSFGTDPRVSGSGAYLVSIPTEEDVSRIVEWASAQGVTKFAVLGPDNAYGHRVEKSLEREALWRGGELIDAVFYEPGDLAPTESAKYLATSVAAADALSPGQVAVLIPERGNRLRAVAPLLQYYDVDVSSVKILGTGLWNDPDVWREPTLAGGVFPTPAPEIVAKYNAQHRRHYQEKPPSMSSLGYDAGLMALAMIASDTISRASIERVDGFLGANGLFRFRADGTPERSLAVLQVQPNGTVRTIDPAKRSFATDGF